jgi:feruloyl esterase
MTMVAAAATAKCDEVDGLKDGLIDDGRKCSFDPVRDVPACRAGEDAPTCLTGAQAEAVRKIYGGPVSNGKPYFAGYMPGADVAFAADFGLAQGILRHLVLDPPQPEYDYLNFDYDKAASTVARWSKIADAKDPDLSKFRKSGGKLIMTYGWADQILQPLQGVRYYESVEAKNKNAPEFARLFMVPGMTHCAGGIGPDRNDAVTAVIDWVEKGKAPDQIIASKVTNNQVVRTRPLCPYPQVARYKGTGSIDDAANFACVAPK